jgi:rsbT antagonist protein RsbS
VTGFSASPTVPVPVPVPVLALGDVLLVTLQGELHDGAAEQLQDDVARRIASSGAPVGGVVIDISGVEIVDSFLGRVLAEVAAAASLLATRTVLAGMRPAVAITLVELGLTLPGLVTALDVEAALSLLGRAPLFAPHVHPEGGA